MIACTPTLPLAVWPALCAHIQTSMGCPLRAVPAMSVSAHCILIPNRRGKKKLVLVLVTALGDKPHLEINHSWQWCDLPQLPADRNSTAANCSFAGICLGFVQLLGEARVCAGFSLGYIIQHTEWNDFALGRDGEEFIMQSNKVVLFHFQLVLFHNKAAFVCSDS